MTQFICRYGAETTAPEQGEIVGWADDDDAIIDITAFPGALIFLSSEPLEARGRFGPEPDRLGAAPASHFPSLAELNAEGADKDDPRRALAGWPITDNRVLPVDMRHWRAPDLTVDVARSAALLALDRAYTAAHDAGFMSDALGKLHLYGSTEAAFGKLQMAGLASLGGQKKAGWSAGIVCAEETEGGFGLPTSVPHTATQVQAVVGDYQSFDDGLQSKRDKLRADVVAASDIAAALAVIWS